MSLCPFGDGRHKRVVWSGEGRSGFSCRLCHKTWEWKGETLVPTYSDKDTKHGK